MQKRSIFTALLMALLVCVLAGASTTALFAQEEAPPVGAKAVWLGHYDAMEAGDLETAMSYVDENVISVVLPPPPGVDPITVGAEAFRNGDALLIGDNVSYQWIRIQEDGDNLTFRVRVDANGLQALGVGPVEFTGTATTRDGLLTSEVWMMEEDDEARLIAAIARAENIALLDRFYGEIFSQGNMETIDEIIGEEFIDHYSGQNGREAFRSFVGLFRTAFPDLQATYKNVLAEGDLVVVEVSFSGTYAGDETFAEIFGVPDSAIGQQFTWSGVDYARIVNGQYVEGWGSQSDFEW